MDIPIIGRQTKKEALVEVCRSFAYKLNLANYGGPQYESADFFASRKMQCSEESVAAVSEQIFEECVAEVRASIQQFKDSMHRKMEAKKAAHPVAAANAKAFEQWKDKQEGKEKTA